MKAIVFYRQHREATEPYHKHSAWSDISEAEKQVNVLKSKGYQAYYTLLDHNYRNGHYFI